MGSHRPWSIALESRFAKRSSFHDRLHRQPCATTVLWDSRKCTHGPLNGRGNRRKPGIKAAFVDLESRLVVRPFSGSCFSHGCQTECPVLPTMAIGHDLVWPDAAGPLWRWAAGKADSFLSTLHCHPAVSTRFGNCRPTPRRREECGCGCRVLPCCILLAPDRFGRYWRNGRRCGDGSTRGRCRRSAERGRGCRQGSGEKARED